VGVKSLLSRFARQADARIFCVAGSRFRDEARLLQLSEGIHVATTPRDANILLIVGKLDSGFVTPTIVAHDALAHPRATVWWRLGADDALVSATFPDAFVVDGSDPVASLRRIHEELLTGQRASEGTLLPDIEPAQWRGVGPYGQGGKAMTGGVPYGRPMPERADDRDGLKLDYLPVRLGPLFTPFPTGLALDVRLQGDVIQDATVENFADPSMHTESIFRNSLRAPVYVRQLELARARSHLHWLSDAVTVAGSRSLSERILRLARRVTVGDGDEIRALGRALRRRGFFGWSTRGIGVVGSNLLEAITGPVARASGANVDSRSEDPIYQQLGFQAVTQDAGDVAARWRQRIEEAAQALDLAERADEERTGGSGITESPRGAVTERGGPSAAIARLVPSLVAGMEWGDAVATVVSLDLDMSEVHAPVDHLSAAS
jgi:hypothetical protein